ncbi:MAG: hypothetical protein HY347_05815 [candidate division NC10 bacterium]|nr:hypothetical protein [candidate division NC10 bacterium]
MNWAHLHLVLNHVPVIGMVLGVVLLAVALVKQSRDLQRVSLGFFILLALLALPVYFTGEPAAKVIEQLPGVSESVIERHEEAALIALVAVEVLGVIALGGVFLSRRPKTIPTWFAITLLLLSIAVGGWMVWTANLGGQIRHTEIRATGNALTPAGEIKSDLPGRAEEAD